MPNEGHSPLGASGSHRWMNCLGQPRLAKLAPPQKSGPSARRGTAAHKVLELTWPRRASTTEQLTPKDFLGKEVLGVDMEEEDIEALTESVRLLDVESKSITVEHMIYSEVVFDLVEIHEDLWGTSDITIAATDFSLLKVIDYKHGTVPVETMSMVDGKRKLNSQLMYYALGAIKKIAVELGKPDLDKTTFGNIFREVWIGILQPRCNHSDGILRMVRVTAKELDDFAIELRHRAKQTDDPKAPLSAGPWCRWCPALNMCGEFTYNKAKQAQIDFMPVSDPVNLKSSLPAPSQLSIEQILKIKEFETVMKDWFNRFDDFIHAKLNRGEEVPGYKLVKKRSNRAWRDTEEVVSKIGMYLSDDEMYNKKLKSPTQMESVLGSKGKALLKDLIVKPDNGTTVAPITDKRAEAIPSAEIEFEVLEERD